MTHSRLKIGLLANTFSPIPGGMEVYLDHLSKALAAEGHDVHVVTRFVHERPGALSALFRSTEPPRRYVKGNVTVHLVAPSPWRRLLLTPTYRLHHHAWTERLAIELYVRAFYKALAEPLGTCDVIHFSGTGREMIGFAASRLAQERSVPFVVTPHMHVGAWGDGSIDFRLYQQAQAVIALTEHERDVYREGGLSPLRIHVQGHGVNVAGTGNGDAIRGELGVGEAPMILFLGRRSTYKGYPLVLESLRSVWKTHPDAHVVIAGPSDSTLTLDPEINSILEDHRVHVLGFVSDAVREDLYAACDVFCLPSTAEAFGLVYLEAGFYAKPVVALDIPTLRELIGDAGSGLLVERTSEDVADALTRLVGDPALRKRLGRAGRHRAEQQRWSQVARNMAAIYRDERSVPSPTSSAPAYSHA